MFDLTSSKLLILGIVALIVVGPKELPFLLRTIGKYVGMIRRQANEFRAQFDEAMREAELDSIKKDLENVARDTENTIRSAQTSFEADVHATTRDLDKSMTTPAPSVTMAGNAPASVAEPVHTHDLLNGLDAPAEPPPPEPSAAVSVPVPAPETVSATPASPSVQGSQISDAARADHVKPDLVKSL